MNRVFLLLAVLLGTVMAETEKAGRQANRLLQEKSPYLLQHAYNPVDWYPWGEEVFNKAKAEKKLILLSIGYSTCHWCHVMERESFQNEKIAAFLNEHFISVKLDREERPDVDHVYMTAFQAMTQQNGGWPLNMFLTPDLKPLTGGTYFPPEDKGGRSGFLTVLKQIHEAWSDNRDDIIKQAEEGHGQMQEYFQGLHRLEAGVDTLKKELITQGVNQSLVQIDQEWGGFGRGMKFPQVSGLRFLLIHGDQAARDAVLMTCRRMMDGGIHDQVGGGFHRYAVDREWLVPHFEKMLYDQAQLLDLYLDAWLMTKEDDFAQTARGIADYVLRDLTDEEGGFYCAQDAQSEGKEGKYFCWTEAELKTLLNDEELKLAQTVLGVTEQGNFYDHSDPKALKGQNVLHFKKTRTALKPEERKKVDAILKKLTGHRSKRVPPATDDKVLASWNGLMIGSLARAGRVLDEKTYLVAAQKAHQFIQRELWQGGKLYHSWREGKRSNSIQAQSYLFYLQGTRRLYEATLDPTLLAFALQLAEGARELFYDENNGGFFQGEKRDDLVFRLKGDFDGAMPTESAVGALEFGILAAITGKKDFRKIMEKTLRSYQPHMKDSPTGMGGMLQALSRYLGEKSRLVITNGKGRQALIETAFRHQRSGLAIIGNDGPVDTFTAGLKAQEDKATAYYCIGETCQLPVTEAGKLAEQLKN